MRTRVAFHIVDKRIKEREHTFRSRAFCPLDDDANRRTRTHDRQDGLVIKVWRLQRSGLHTGFDVVLAMPGHKSLGQAATHSHKDSGCHTANRAAVCFRFPANLLPTNFAGRGSNQNRLHRVSLTRAN